MDLKALLATNKISASPEAAEKLAAFSEFFQKANKKLNLCRFKGEKEFLLKHVLDSALLLRYFELKPWQKTLDLGTGGGLPGLVLAILRPEMDFTLVDAVNKKAQAVEEMTQKLGLKNVKVVTGRAEDLAHDVDFREKFELVVARAVAPLNTLLEYLAGFTQIGGSIFCYKGKNGLEELEKTAKAQELLGINLSRKILYALPENLGERALFEFVKTKTLAEKYPRAAGKPKKRPL